MHFSCISYMYVILYGTEVWLWCLDFEQQPCAMRCARRLGPFLMGLARALRAAWRQRAEYTWGQSRAYEGAPPEARGAAADRTGRTAWGRGACRSAAFALWDESSALRWCCGSRRGRASVGLVRDWAGGVLSERAHFHSRPPRFYPTGLRTATWPSGPGISVQQLAILILDNFDI